MENLGPKWVHLWPRLVLIAKIASTHIFPPRERITALLVNQNASENDYIVYKLSLESISAGKGNR